MLSLALFLVVVEGLVRLVDPTPRLQVVRGGGQGHHELSMLHGQPVWAEPGTDARIAADCEAPRRAMLLGSSILYGTGYGPEDSVGQRVQEAVDVAAPDTWCVHNLAQAGFTSHGKLALAKAWIPRLKPDVVVWELWTNEPGGFTMIAGDAYNLTGVPVDTRGYPAAPIPLPEAVHHVLFEHSKAWWYATLTSLSRPRDAAEAAWREVHEDTLPAVAELVAAYGGRLIMLSVPQLDRPFALSADEPYWQYAPVRAWAEREGHEYAVLAEALRDEDHEALRHDPCCHYNREGQQRVGRVIAELLQAQGSP
jgi:hypothetical protein